MESLQKPIQRKIRVSPGNTNNLANIYTAALQGTIHCRVEDLSCCVMGKKKGGGVMRFHAMIYDVLEVEHLK